MESASELGPESASGAGKRELSPRAPEGRRPGQPESGCLTNRGGRGGGGRGRKCRRRLRTAIAPRSARPSGLCKTALLAPNNPAVARSLSRSCLRRKTAPSSPAFLPPWCRGPSLQDLCGETSPEEQVLFPTSRGSVTPAASGARFVPPLCYNSLTRGRLALVFEYKTQWDGK